MDATELLWLLRRRWIGALVLVGVVLAAVLGVVLIVPREYQASATMLVLRQGPDIGPNPYTIVDPSQTQAAGLLVTVLQSEEVEAELVPADSGAELTVSNLRGTVDQESPFLVIDVVSTNALTSTQIARTVTERAREELRSQQEELLVPDDLQLILADVVTPEAATASRSSALRAGAFTGAGGLTLAILALAGYDRMQRSRATARAAARPYVGERPRTGDRPTTGDRSHAGDRSGPYGPPGGMPRGAGTRGGPGPGNRYDAVAGSRAEGVRPRRP